MQRYFDWRFWRFWRIWSWTQPNDRGMTTPTLFRGLPVEKRIDAEILGGNGALSMLKRPEGHALTGARSCR